MNELELIARVRTMLIDKTKHKITHDNNPTPIGDDCALISSPKHGRLITTVDLLIDGVHFDTATTSLDLIGKKAVSVNHSDLAASGARPNSILAAVAFPKSWSTDQAAKLMQAMIDTAHDQGADVIGGDTNLTDGPLTICITAIGETHSQGAITRSGAKPGDLVLVTGHLGGSLPSGHHLSFSPRIEESQWLLDHSSIHAMMDLSDGLALDAKRLAEASKISITFDARSIPCKLKETTSQYEALKRAFCDGEDFELLFTTDPKTAQIITKTFPWPCGVRVIGTCHAGNGEIMISHLPHTCSTNQDSDAAKPLPIEWKGYIHQS